MKMATCVPVVLLYPVSERNHRALHHLLSHIRQETVDLWSDIILSAYMKWLSRVNNTHKKRIKIEHIDNLANKTIANHKIMVYACMRYPILVWHTVLVQNI